jgi:hypothetical protein
MRSITLSLSYVLEIALLRLHKVTLAVVNSF